MTPAPLDTVQVTFPDGCAAGTTVRIQSLGRAAMEVTVPGTIARGGQFLASVAPAPPRTPTAPATPSAAVAAAALRVIDALLERDTGGQLLAMRNTEGLWAGQLCRPGEAQGKLLYALHQALGRAASAGDVSALDNLSVLVDDHTVPRRVGAELLRQATTRTVTAMAATPARTAASAARQRRYQYEEADDDGGGGGSDDGGGGEGGAGDGDREGAVSGHMALLDWVLEFLRVKVETAFNINDGPGGACARVYPPPLQVLSTTVRVA